jgi:hypothetical protein
VQNLRWSRLDRRTTSNWLPDYQFAGIGNTSPAAGSFTRDMTNWLPLLLTALLVTFNLLDSFFTARALSLGYTEANPVMAGLFTMSMPMGMLFKSVVVGLGALTLWKFRHLEMAMRGMTAVTAFYGAVIMYHMYFQIIIG